MFAYLRSDALRLTSGSDDHASHEQVSACAEQALHLTGAVNEANITDLAELPVNERVELLKRNFLRLVGGSNRPG